MKLLLILLNKENIKKEPDHKLNRRILTSLISKTLLTARRLDGVNILQRSFSYGRTRTSSENGKSGCNASLKVTVHGNFRRLPPLVV